MKNLRAAAGPDTKLIINDTILPLACEDPATTSAEDGPTLPPLVPKGSAILPNMGNATLSGYLVDISVSICVCQGPLYTATLITWT